MSVNKVILVGNLGADPEVTFLPSGDPVTNLRVATSYSWTRDGQRQEQTEWHRVVLFKHQAEFAAEYLKKGRTVYVEGRISTRKWTDDKGVDRYSTDIIGSEIKPVGPRPTDATSQGAQDMPDF